MNSPIDFQKLISVQRIFEIRPEPIGNYLYLVIVFALLLIVAIILKIIAKKKKNTLGKVYSSFGSLCFFVSLLGLFIIFMRWQSIPYIGSRFALLVMVVTALCWLTNIMIFLFIIAPKKEKIKKAKENFEKYLPQRQVSLPQRQVNLPRNGR